MVSFAMGRVHKGANHDPKAISVTICFMIGFAIWTMYVHKHCNRRPNHEENLRTIASGLRADFAFLSSLPVHTHKSRSERALRSHVLRIRFSRLVIIQNALFFRISKAWFERALHSQRVKSGFQIRKGSESRSETAFGTWLTPLWTGPWSHCLVFPNITISAETYIQSHFAETYNTAEIVQVQCRVDLKFTRSPYFCNGFLVHAFPMYFLFIQINFLLILFHFLP